MGEMLPDAIDDAILSEILLRLPPQPSSLPRASAVSKRWHSIACDPGFCRRFRLHHRRNPPLLGFFDSNEFLNFEPTLDAPNRVLHSRFSLIPREDDDRYSDCGSRHGLVLIFDHERRHILVWDPVTGKQDRLDIPKELEDEDIMTGAVLRDAGDVHFRVVLVRVGKGFPQHQQGRCFARVYSTETKLWGDVISMPLPPDASTETYISDISAVLVGESLYWQLYGSFCGVLEFNLEGKSLNVIGLPLDIINSGHFLVIREEGGGLGLLSLSGFTAQLWKRKTDCDGLASWVLGRTIELDKLLSLNPAEHEHISIRGFAEENNLVFLHTVIGFFLLQLPSLHFTFMKHTETSSILYYRPFECVYTAEARMNGPEEFDLSEQYIGSHASNAFRMDTSREEVRRKMKEANWWQNMLFCQNIDIRHGQYNNYKGQREIMKELKAQCGDDMQVDSQQQPSDGTLSYGAWSKGRVSWADFEDVSSAPSSSSARPHGKSNAYEEEDEEFEAGEDEEEHSDDYDDYHG